jgi:diaminohydroxyphosphoribosylaminopyrimidine deaminase/5-amino-6-(5-phosphoribosylamino)uracil reductase
VNRQHPPSTGDAIDRYWMRQSLALAALGEGSTRPNPLVGCVIVRDGQAVGWGYHRAAGEPHAESVALAQAGEQARDSTLYVNLEPCAHRGLTAPCDQQLIDRGVGRVVVAIGDPNPVVDGRGLTHLRDAGIEVDLGVLADEAETLNASFLHWHRTGRPLVTLKAAISLDGRISARDGVSKWISAGPARRFAHRLRFRSDAILVGAGTARFDNPRLTVRLPGVSALRQRVVLSGSLELAPDLHLCRDNAAPNSPTRIYSDQGNVRDVGSAQIVEVPSDADGLDLAAVLDDLGRLGIQSLLVEGGGKTHGSFLEAGLAQRMVLFVSGKLIGSQGSTPMIDFMAGESPKRARRLSVERSMVLGDDRVVEGRLVAPVSESAA